MADSRIGILVPCSPLNFNSALQDNAGNESSASDIKNY